MTAYDFSIIQKFADRLYRQASTVIAIYTFFGIVIGFTGGYVVGDGFGLGLLGAILFGLLGFWLGRERAFQLKLQAQTALCQAKIEENTRR
jgi:hypothetical protein